MCGIAGIKGANRIALNNMLTKLNHRGPDDEGVHVCENFSLGMKRLAIIDLLTGHQPIWNENKTLCIFLNGEIYNFKPLKKYLQEKGHIFTSCSDTEVIVHLFEEYGYDCPKYLHGMFSFCIYNITSDELYLARDRFGEKPLYYYLANDLFAFSSEINSLLQSGIIKRKLNQSALFDYLTFGFTFDHSTLITNIFSLPQGCSAIYKDNSIKITPYFKINYSIPESHISEEQILSTGKDILFKAVEKQMISDVPIGAFLSGGIDSSSVAAIMSELSDTKIKTFNVKFEETSFDESAIARKVSKHINSDHTEIYIPNQTFSENIFWNILTHIGQPFIDSSAIPSYLISEEIKKHVKVALSGDGGDEVFAGYSDFLWGNKINTLTKLPVPFRKLAISCIKSLPEFHTNPFANTLRGAEKALSYSLDTSDLYRNLYQYFHSTELKQLLLSSSIESYSSVPFFDKYDQSFLRSMMRFRIQYLLTEDMLIKIDRMSMYHSLEVRSPFLDPELFEFSCKLPNKYLIKNGKTKWILRELMKDYLPREVFEHPKMGFSIPLHKFFNSEFEKFARSTIHKKHPLNEIINYNKSIEILNTGIQQMQSTSKESVYKSSHKLWILLQLYAWFEAFEIEL
ncbi:MAG: asparagine synthase (glutamine-hydrolyzing) [Saprospiraceae bacterium]|nr:asparagine synthase (glutamine-hydrolyzing) [Saprospiraceae bacterium]